jgi:hypothetical protein
MCVCKEDLTEENEGKYHLITGFSYLNCILSTRINDDIDVYIGFALETGVQYLLVTSNKAIMVLDDQDAYLSPSDLQEGQKVSAEVIALCRLMRYKNDPRQYKPKEIPSGFWFPMDFGIPVGPKHAEFKNKELIIDFPEEGQHEHILSSLRLHVPGSSWEKTTYKDREEQEKLHLSKRFPSS